jgi:general secretion pathway protein G
MRQMKKVCGFTLIELIVTVAIVAILASVAMPMLQVSAQRTKENELRAQLRQIREAIDQYKHAVDQKQIESSIDETGYPPNLDILVEGVEDISKPDKRVLKFLRKIPYDPMLAHDEENNKPAWGLRSYASSAKNPQAGKDVYDVYSLSPLVGLNGVPYAQW